MVFHDKITYTTYLEDQQRLFYKGEGGGVKRENYQKLCLLS